MRTIIPCAGYGTRVGMAPYEAKELLDYKGKPLIAWAVERSINPLLVIREEKECLVSWARKNYVDHMVIEGAEEWPDTILKSAPRWHEENALILPDTEFSPTDIVRQIETALKEGSNVVAGVHSVGDQSKWGAIITDNAQELLVEKPQHLKGCGGIAWGVLGWKKAVGKNLFSACLKRAPYTLGEGFVKVPLEYFKDVTR